MGMESPADGKRERAGLKRYCERHDSGFCGSINIRESDWNDRQQNEGHACKTQSDGRSKVLLCWDGWNGAAGGNKNAQGKLVDKGGSGLRLGTDLSRCAGLPVRDCTDQLPRRRGDIINRNGRTIGVAPETRR